MACYHLTNRLAAIIALLLSFAAFAAAAANANSYGVQLRARSDSGSPSAAFVSASLVRRSLERFRNSRVEPDLEAGGGGEYVAQDEEAKKKEVGIRVIFFFAGVKTMIGAAHAAGTTGAIITGISNGQPGTAAAYSGGMFAAKEVANQFADRIPNDQQIWKSTKKAGTATGKAVVAGGQAAIDAAAMMGNAAVNSCTIMRRSPGAGGSNCPSGASDKAAAVPDAVWAIEVTNHPSAIWRGPIPRAEEQGMIGLGWSTSPTLSCDSIVASFQAGNAPTLGDYNNWIAWACWTWYPPSSWPANPQLSCTVLSIADVVAQASSQGLPWQDYVDWCSWQCDQSYPCGIGRTCDSIACSFSQGNLPTDTDISDWRAWSCATWYPSSTSGTCDSIYAACNPTYQDKIDWATWGCNQWYSSMCVTQGQNTSGSSSSGTGTGGQNTSGSSGGTDASSDTSSSGNSNADAGGSGSGADASSSSSGSGAEADSGSSDSASSSGGSSGSGAQAGG
ncbi:hypothetical protein HK405_008420 [Cladochytrium tenue]|nr:hypothetical protein HK405_008420 [Cladochytrium tenue]